MTETQFQNLWHIANRDHLLSCLIESKKKFVVLTLVLIDQEDSIKVMLRKYIKEKSKIYKNIIFLYYPLKKDDFGKIWELLPNDIDSYPRIYHLYDVDKMLGEVWNLKDKSKLADSDYLFKKFHNYYINFDPTQNNNQNNQESSNEKINEETNETEKNNYENQQNQPNQQIQPNQYTEPKQNKLDIVTERKKLIDKIQLIQQCAEEFKTSFIKDIQKRKEKEKKIKLKQKENKEENKEENKDTDSEKKNIIKNKKK